MTTQPPANKGRKKGPKLTQDGKITVFDTEDTSYGIRELIDLIRYIPEGQDVFFGAEMIKKTLNSMQLSIHDIMQDGVEKRKLAAKTIQHLVAEITDYERRIQSLKGHIRHLRFELGEIQDTCHYLLSDDADLAQYQHILEDVPRSATEGTQATQDKPPSPPVVEPLPEKTPSESSPQEQGRPVEAQDFEPSETLVDHDSSSKAKTDSESDFVPDALKRPDEDYEQAEPDSHLTDEVFDPDRFDDENGANTAVSNPSPAPASEETSPPGFIIQDESDTFAEPDLEPELEPESELDLEPELESEFDSESLVVEDTPVPGESPTDSELSLQDENDLSGRL